MRIISQNVTNFGIEVSKDTIFRIKNKIEGISSKLEKFSSYNFGKQIISEIKFKKSELTPNGPIYTDLLVVKGKQ